MNTAEKKKEIERNPYALGLDPYSKVSRIVSIPLVKQELTLRNIPFTDVMNVTALVTLLKENENKAHNKTGKNFKPASRDMTMYDHLFEDETIEM